MKKFSLALALAMILQLAALAGGVPAPSSNPVIISYTVTDSGGAPVSSITKGQKVNFSIIVKNTAVTTDQINDAADLDVSRTLDNFTGGTVGASVIDSTGTEPLLTRINFTNATYSGTGQKFSFLLGYKNLNVPYSTLSMTVSECTEYTPPDPTPSHSPEPTPTPTPAGRITPIVEIARGKFSRIVQPGEYFNVGIEITNRSPVEISYATASFSTSEGLVLAGDIGSHIISEGIRGYQTVKFNVYMRALGEITSPSQSLTVDLKYTYPTDTGGEEAATASERIMIPAEPGKSAAEQPPTVEITREQIKEPVRAGDEFDVTVAVRNRGAADILSPVATLSASEGLILVATSTSSVMSDIKGGQTGRLVVRLRAAKEIASPSQSLDIDLKYKYMSGNTETAGTAAQKLLILAETVKKQDELSPVVMITREKVAGSVKVNDRFGLKVTVQNLNKYALQSPLAVVTPSDALQVLDDSGAVQLSDIPAGGSASFTLSLAAGAEIPSASQSVDVELRYYYKPSETLIQGTTTAKLPVPATVSKGAGVPPIIQIRRESIKGAVAPDSSFTISMTAVNRSDKAVTSPVATLSASDAFQLQGNSSSIILPDIPPGGSVPFSASFKCAKEISASSQSVNVEIKYYYGSNESGTATERLPVTAVVSAGESDTAAPNILISDYSFGGDQVAAGELFDLDVTFANLGSNLAVENVVMSLDMGEALTINASTNTFFYKSLAPGATQHETVQLRALAGAQTNTGKITVGFKYDYLVANKRASGTSTQTISIPVFQPDRFEVNAPMIPQEVYAYQEFYLSIPYVNKGKADVANTRAELVGEMDAVEKVLNVGNITPGSSGTLDFILTPPAPGQAEFTVSVTYETLSGEVKKREIPIKLNVVEMPMEQPGMMPDDPSMQGDPDGGFPWLLIAIIAGAAGALVAVILLVRRKRRRAKAKAAELFDWNQNFDAGAPLPPTGGETSQDTQSIVAEAVDGTLDGKNAETAAVAPDSKRDGDEN